MKISATVEVAGREFHCSPTSTLLSNIAGEIANAAARIGTIDTIVLTYANNTTQTVSVFWTKITTNTYKTGIFWTQAATITGIELWSGGTAGKKYFAATGLNIGVKKYQRIRIKVVVSWSTISSSSSVNGSANGSVSMSSTLRNNITDRMFGQNSTIVYCHQVDFYDSAGTLLFSADSISASKPTTTSVKIVATKNPVLTKTVHSVKFRFNGNGTTTITLTTDYKFYKGLNNSATLTLAFQAG